MKFNPRYLLVVMALLPIGLFYWLVVGMSVNVPYQDDFDALLEPVWRLQSQPFSLADFWREMYTQDDERRIVMVRLAAFSLNEWTGELNMRHMIVLGASTLLVVVLVIGGWGKSSGVPLEGILPVVWMIFTIQFFEAVFWGMIPLQHVAVFVWTFLCIWLLTRGSRATFAGALIAGALAVFSDVSGNFVLPVGAVVLALQQRWKPLLAWGALMGALTGYYFAGLEVPEYRPGFTDSLADPFNMLKVLFSLFGLWADPGPTFPMDFRQGWVLILGLATLGLAGYLIISRGIRLIRTGQRPDRNEVFVWAGLLFIGIVLGVLAVGRASEGVASVFNPRYRHMYAFWMVFCYLLLWCSYPGKMRERTVVRGVWVVVFVLGVNAYYQYWGPLDRFRKVLLTDGYEWYHNRALPSSPIYLAMQERVDTLYEAVYAAGIYSGEQYPFAGLPGAPVTGAAVVEVRDFPDAIEVFIPDFERASGKDDGAYVILRSEEEVHVLPAYQQQRPVYRLAGGGGSIYYPGAKTDALVKAFLKSPVLTIEIGVIDGPRQYRLQTGQQIRLQR